MTIIGWASFINIFFGIIRIKFLAVLLGPVGVGLIGIYGTIASLVGTVVGLGINSSGVRQIAEFVASNEEKRVSRTITSIRRITMLLGIIGMLTLMVFSGVLSRLTFNSDDHVHAFILLSITILFTAISSGQIALIQGMRRVRDLAILSILGAFFGTIFSLPLIYFWGNRGIVPFLIIVSLMSVLASWWYARKINIKEAKMTFRETLEESRELLKLGVVFMFSSLMSTAVVYGILTLINGELGLVAAGHYQAVATLSSIYVSFILNAMGTDFYPRLTAVCKDNTACNKLVNEQAEISILLAVPGIIATLTFAPLVIEAFYSSEFLPAIDMLRWQMLGITLRIVSWSMAFIIVAKGEKYMYLITELSANMFHILFVFFFMKYYGLTGVGVAFFTLYLFYTVLVFFITRKLSGFSWSSKNIRICVTIFPLVMIVFATSFLLERRASMIIGSILTFTSIVYTVKSLSSVTGISDVAALIIKLKSCFGFIK